jgi:hypothetical protein
VHPIEGDQYGAESNLDQGRCEVSSEPGLMPHAARQGLDYDHLAASPIDASILVGSLAHCFPILSRRIRKLGLRPDD